MTKPQESRSDTCPACDTASIDDSVDCFEGICDNCGFVIREGANSVSLEWEITDGTFTRSEDRAWMSACRVRNATEQQLAEAFKKIEVFADEFSLSDEVREQTADLYCNAFRTGITDGRATSCIIAACLCLASRQAGKPIPRNRLTEFQDVDENKFHLSHLALCDNLDIEPHTPEPQDYTPFLQAELSLTDTAQNELEHFLSPITEKQAFVGKDPAGIAAGGVYVLLDDFTQVDVAETAGVSTETVRQRENQLQGCIEDD